MQLPLVSVLMPVFNCEKYVASAMVSILRQSYKHIELIVVDDCSTDGTEKIISVTGDARVKYLKNEHNSGPSASLNKGLKHSRGKYIAVMHADDIAIENRLELQVNHLEFRSDVDILGCQYININEDGVMISGESCLPCNNDAIVGSLLFANPICHPTIMFRKSSIDGAEILYDEHVRLCEDYNFWTNAVLKGLKIENLSKTGIHYRRHKLQASAANHLKEQQQFEVFRENFRSQYCKKLGSLAERIDCLKLVEAIQIASEIQTCSSVAMIRSIFFSQLRMKLHSIIKLSEKNCDFGFMSYLHFLKLSRLAGWDSAILFQLFKKQLNIGKA